MRNFVMAWAIGVAACSVQANTPYSIVVPFVPGGASDAYARTVAKELQQELGVPFVVENKPGAGGSVGAAGFAKLPKTTRSLFLGTISTHAINPHLYKDISYNARTDFQPVAMVLSLPNMLAVNANTAIRSVADLADEGKRRNLSFGSAGTGSSAHLSAEVMVLDSGGMRATHIPYKGATPANMDLIGGQIDFVFDNISSVLPLVKSGKLRGLAVTSKERSHQATEVPTMHESGFKDYEVISWFGFWLPKDSDPQTVQTIAAALQKIYAKPAFIAQIRASGATPVLKTGNEFEQFLTAEQNRWGELVRKLGIRIE
jgi:tripartite-type tricarboxylate transporter receptor subunit TctC